MNNFCFKQFDIKLEGSTDEFEVLMSGYEEQEGLILIKLEMTSKIAKIPSKFSLSWSIPDIEVHSQWNPTVGNDRGIFTDWSNKGYKSNATYGAPVHTLLNYNGENKLTVAVSDAMNPLEIKALLNEETANIICTVTFFDGPMQPISRYEAILRLHTRAEPFYEVLNQVQEWWASMPSYKPAKVPEHARLPMYSAWYCFHQNIQPDEIIKQCKLAKELGCESIIMDDGWQTDDNSRGYAYCGDWEVATSKIPSMKDFVYNIHKVGLKFLLWYSVPFVGKYSKICPSFEGKFLFYREDLKAYVLDPRFADVRDFLINTYEKAVREWDLDGLKLDFIDEFSAVDQNVYCSEKTNEMDYISVSEAVDRLLKDTLARLCSIKPDFMVEFRQCYIGPLMRTYGNMFRASDCPNDSLSNRQRTIDVRLTCGDTVVHSDPLMWSCEDTVESAALYIINVLYSVPQISVVFDKIPKKHYKMLKFWLKFWRINRDVLLDGKLLPEHPEANYSKVIALNDKKLIATSYSSPYIRIPETHFEEIILINGSYEKRLLLETNYNYGNTSFKIFNCCGELIEKDTIDLIEGIHSFDIPPAGLIVLRPISQ